MMMASNDEVSSKYNILEEKQYMQEEQLHTKTERVSFAQALYISVKFEIFFVSLIRIVSLDTKFGSDVKRDEATGGKARP